jgi:hypothetical protein
MQNKNLMTLLLIVLTTIVCSTIIGIPSVQAMWPFDQMFPGQSPPLTNQTSNSSQSSGTPTGQAPY